MADITMVDAPPVAFNGCQKRAFEEEPAAPVSTPTKALASAPDSPLSVLGTPLMTPSPIKRAMVLAVAPLASSKAAPPHSTTVNKDPPAKKRKVYTPEEREKMRLEEEERKKAKAEAKALRDEEKRLEEEAKQKRKEEKEAKQRAKELEEEKKQKSQLKLASFFMKAKPSEKGSTKTTVEPTLSSSTEPISLAPDAVMQDADVATTSPQKAMQQSVKSHYERHFLPFQLPSRSILAPYNRFIEDPAKRAAAISRLDELSGTEDRRYEPVTVDTFQANFGGSISRGLEAPSILEIAEQHNGSSVNPVDLTSEDKLHNPLGLLQHIPMKYLFFGEDVRPAYYGTFSRPHTRQQAAKLARNPYSRTLQKVDYDYDSEAEWEEGEADAEDCISDDEDDIDDDGDDADMEGFLDDEEDPQAKRRLMTSDLQPISSGLCWEDVDGVSKLNDGSGAICTDLRDFQMGFLLEPQPQSIDPFSTAYWTPDAIPISKLNVASKNSLITSSMKPPRQPLMQRPVNGMLNTLNSSAKSSSSVACNVAKPPKRMIAPEYLDDFKAEINGSDLTKIALIEALKKKFPKFPKDAITNTVTEVAQRTGATNAEKRWSLL
ncbi:hypothetical protein P154DRAFT_524292 [Amniculicola lignicola CBS 123094]|uniref:Chromatin assembly factor 1 subunit A n=1 Tax=Amniculicola lignicola CBS 123094 TaxID=1392246 RepID=A0A6A5WDI0_9PLEO|nr:hypothetical protein P154DRAFT_524292 [Amniculicola lignicola CBS 123094]